MTLLKPTASQFTSVYGLQREEQIAHTHDGMAYFAGSGPLGTTCRECLHFQSEGRWRSGKVPGMLKDGRCARYRQMTGRRGGEFPPTTASCKYFTENERAPKLHEPRNEAPAQD